MKGLDNISSYWIYKNSYTIFTVSDYFTELINNIVGRSIASTIRPLIVFSEEDIIFGRNYMEKPVFRILFFGRLTKDKGLNELLNAVSRLGEGRNHFRLTVAGEGEFKVEAGEIIDNLGIGDYVKLIGGVYDTDEIKQCYLDSDIYILPTYHEGFPRTLYEAMIFGTPIITTLVGGMPALMKHGFNCWEIKPRSVESIKEALVYAMCNYIKMGELARNATETVNQLFKSRRLSHAESLNRVINV
jgi:glycosyltransferase involved in cell wall biosynthesis